jgi:hypothetical protein
VIVELFPLCLVEIKCVAPREIFKLVREMEAKRSERERENREISRALFSVVRNCV